MTPAIATSQRVVGQRVSPRPSESIVMLCCVFLLWFVVVSSSGGVDCVVAVSYRIVKWFVSILCFSSIYIVSLTFRATSDETMADNDPTITIAAGGGGVGATAASATTAAMLNQPIVIDCGSSSMKAGFAGGTKPKVGCAMI